MTRMQQPSLEAAAAVAAVWELVQEPMAPQLLLVLPGRGKEHSQQRRQAGGSSALQQRSFAAWGAAVALVQQAWLDQKRTCWRWQRQRALSLCLRLRWRQCCTSPSRFPQWVGAAAAAVRCPGASGRWLQSAPSSSSSLHAQPCVLTNDGKIVEQRPGEAHANQTVNGQGQGL